MWWFDVERECIRLQVNFPNPALVMKLWCEIGLSMNFLVLCSFIYKMRLLQPCGKINNDLSNRIQLCVRAKTRVRESQLLEAGRRWEGAPNPAPISGGGATSKMGSQFSLAASPGLGIAAYCYPGYWVSAALCVCDFEGLQIWTLGQGK